MIIKDKKEGALLINSVIVSFFILMMLAILITINLTRYQELETLKQETLNKAEIQRIALDVWVQIEDTQTNQVINQVEVIYQNQLYQFEIEYQRLRLTVNVNQALEIVKWTFN